MLLHKVQRGLYRAGGRSLHVFVSAGEPSGDMFAAATMRAIRHQSQDKVSFCGIGGEMMRAEGLDPIFEMSELSAMGIFELIQHLPRLRKRMQEAISAAKLSRPDIVLTVDSKGFNNRLLRALKRNVLAARAGGAVPVGVCTGMFIREQLQAAVPDATILTDLSD
eukprot:CAMPEP_0202825316 /NCGR_PEP_ID=MMETSP1389-20130828/12962_1 /ASSEMBLY_ACC=CAM_ASM_000865 /TAXON_ID=302021 /ORGANISM="Rhodomonas sp., Strain CCMP768" /LENGTH=164 /DNA_ID=CAMNT_0049498527 /DNA_START=245 /DNA_END=740 /DNA_ORIENTATION=-